MQSALLDDVRPHHGRCSRVRYLILELSQKMML